MRIHSMI